MAPDLETAVTTVTNATSLGDLQDAAAEFITARGFQSFSFHMYRPDISFVGIDLRDEAWITHYDREGFMEKDPVSRAALRSSRAFTWEDCATRGPFTTEEQRVFNDARDFGFHGGAEIPIHGPRHEHCSFAVYGMQSDDAFCDAWKRQQGAIKAFAFSFHDSFRRLSEIPELEDLPKLSSRETECLVWTARSKTAWEIGEILTISERTVIHHLRSACKKMYSVSKHQAVIKAILCGLIVP